MCRRQVSRTKVKHLVVNRDKSSQRWSDQQITPCIVPALPDLTKLFPSTCGPATPTVRGSTSADHVPTTNFSSRQDNLERPLSLIPGWQRRISTWVEEQARLWAATYSGPGPQARLTRKSLKDDLRR
ncbi:hypothetical protein L209DRAFT_561275 [Thermothelomyces heterothallicus CBS 203.75]